MVASPGCRSDFNAVEKSFRKGFEEMSDSEQRGFDELFMQRPESIEQLIEGMSADVYASLKLAIELGKWGDGTRLQAEQIDFCMQAIILYEAKYLPETERIGFDLSSSCRSKTPAEEVQKLSVVTDNDFSSNEREAGSKA